MNGANCYPNFFVFLLSHLNYPSQWVIKDDINEIIKRIQLEKDENILVNNAMENLTEREKNNNIKSIKNDLIIKNKNNYENLLKIYIDELFLLPQYQCIINDKEKGFFFAMIRRFFYKLKKMQNTNYYKEIFSE